MVSLFLEPAPGFAPVRTEGLYPAALPGRTGRFMIDQAANANRQRWRPLMVEAAGPPPPATMANQGTLYYDNTNFKLYGYTGSGLSATTTLIANGDDVNVTSHPCRQFSQLSRLILTLGPVSFRLHLPRRVHFRLYMWPDTTNCLSQIV